MATDNTAFFCRECGAKSAVWIARCPQCGAWNSYEQEVIHRSGSGQLKNLSTPKAVTMLMSNIECSNEQRIDLKDDELNRGLGGGLVLGSLVLIGGEPGIAKAHCCSKWHSTVKTNECFTLAERRVQAR